MSVEFVDLKEMTLAKLAAKVMGVSEKWAAKDCDDAAVDKLASMGHEYLMFDDDLKACTDDRKENVR